MPTDAHECKCPDCMETTRLGPYCRSCKESGCRPGQPCQSESAWAPSPFATTKATAMMTLKSATPTGCACCNGLDSAGMSDDDFCDKCDAANCKPGKDCRRDEEWRMGSSKTADESGYQHCGCRDCMETTIGEAGDFCDDCQAAGCEPDSECQAENAYDHGGKPEAADKDENFSNWRNQYNASKKTAAEGDDSDHAWMSDVDLQSLGEKMQHWHSSSGDPIYAVGSYFSSGKRHPQAGMEQKALAEFEKLFSRAKTPEGAAQGGWNEEDVEELYEILSELEEVIASGPEEHDASTNTAGGDADFEAAKRRLSSGNDWSGTVSGFKIWIGEPAGSRVGQFEATVTKDGKQTQLRSKTVSGILQQVVKAMGATQATASVRAANVSRLERHAAAARLIKIAKELMAITKKTAHDLEGLSFLDAYIVSALWSSTDESDERGGNPMDDNYGPEDVTPECKAKMAEDCKKFQSENAEALAASGLDDAQTGFDFWLTRNGHGANFLDREYETKDAGEKAAIRKLYEASKKFGEVNLYVGDNGEIDCG